MADISIQNIAGKIGSDNVTQIKPANGQTGSSFDAIINEAIAKVSQVQNDVDTAVGELASGGDITNAMLAMEKADMTFQIMVEVRNKLLSTYEEIMSMGV